MGTLISLPEDLAPGLAVEATKRGMTVDALTAEIIGAQVEARTHRLSIIGMGASTSGRNARADEEMLAEGFGRDSLR